MTLGVIGHVDHGKTALVRALTGMQTDRLPEEQARGISIALGFAHLRVGEAEADLIDMPGHERFVRTMVSGATGIDAVLLVVDARDGVMPQTREHVDIAALLGVRRAILAVSRIDLAEPAHGEAAAQAAGELLTASGFSASAAIGCSAATGEGIEALRRAVAGEAGVWRPRADDGFCWLPIDRAFSSPGHGTIVTGTLRRGTLSVSDVLEIVPAAAPARVRGLQVHGARVARAWPGQRVAVNLRHVERGEVPRGTALATPAALPASAWISVRLRSVATAPSLVTGMPLRLLFGTGEVDARLRLLDCDALEPGAEAMAQLHCAAPIAVPARERFILRTASPACTVGGGVVLDPQTSRQRRHAKAVLDQLAGLGSADPARIVRSLVMGAGSSGIATRRLARLAGVSLAQAIGYLAEGGAVLTAGGEESVSMAGLDRLAAELVPLLAPHMLGLPIAVLQALLPEISRGVLDAAIAQQIAAGGLARSGNIVRSLHADRAGAEGIRARLRAEALAALILKAGLSPPDIAAIAPDPPARQLLRYLLREGVVIRTVDRVQNREIVFHRDAIEAARRKLEPLLTGDGLLTGEIGAALGISRKFSVPLLEHLDAVRFTRRIGDRRVLAS